MENEDFQSEIGKEIVKLFGEFDMMTLYDNDQTRVRKVKQLVEKYQTITQEVIVKLHEKTLEVKTNELDRTKEELQLSKSKILTLSKRVQELEKEKNQVSGQKPPLKPDLCLNSESKSQPEKKSFPASNSKEKTQLTAKSIHEEKKMNCVKTEVVDGTLEGSDNQSESIVETLIEAMNTDLTNSKIGNHVGKFIKESNVREDFEGNKNPELASLMKKDHKKGKKSKDKKSKEHQCPQSDAKFKHRSSLKDHIKANGTNETSSTKMKVNCQQCPKSFKCPKYLKKHMRTTHATGPPTYSCDKCGKRFLIQNYLTTHIRMTHSDAKFICNECGTEYTRKYSLTRHIQNCKKTQKQQ